MQKTCDFWPLFHVLVFSTLRFLLFFPHILYWHIPFKIGPHLSPKRCGPGLGGGGVIGRVRWGDVDVLGVGGGGGRAGVFISIHVLYGSDLLFMYTILNRVRAHP